MMSSSAAAAGQPDAKNDEEGRDRAHHEHVAMGEIDHADDAVDHRVADGDQAVDRPEGDAVDELLEKILHAPPLCFRLAFLAAVCAVLSSSYNADKVPKRSIPIVHV